MIPSRRDPNAPSAPWIRLIHVIHLVRVISPAGYLTGIIKCAYGVPGNMTYGTFVFVAAVGYPANMSPMFNTIMCGPVSTHLPLAAGVVANGSVLLASDPPISM